MLSRFRSSLLAIFQLAPSLMLTCPRRPLLPAISITVAAVTNSAVPPNLNSAEGSVCERERGSGEVVRFGRGRQRYVSCTGGSVRDDCISIARANAAAQRRERSSPT